MARFFTDDEAYTYFVTKWMRDYIEIAAEAYVAGHGTLIQTFHLTFKEADRRADKITIPRKIWLDVAERELTSAIGRRMYEAKKAEERIRRIVAAQFDALSAIKNIETASSEANEGVLSVSQVEAVLENELAWWRRRNRCRRRRF